METIDLKKTYKGKKVFITGHTGFKGTWLLQWLHLLGAEIKGYALAPQHEKDLFNLVNGSQMCDSIIADIRNKAALTDAIVSFTPDFIFHLAAQPLVRESYQIPTETFDVNAMGTVNVLDALRNLQNPCTAILITTDKVYENKEWDYPYREIDRLGGYDPYSASKACAELIIQSYAKSFFHPEQFSKHKKGIASTRAGNVIGGGDWAKDRIVPDIIRSLSSDQPIKVRNPRSVRPWQHVLEPLGGYLLLGSKMSEDAVKYNGAWNFGPHADDNMEVEELVHIALKAWGDGTYETPQLLEQPHEANLLKLDINKAINQLQWKPQYNAAQAINKTIKWYKEYFLNESYIKDFTIQQIEEYIGEKEAIPVS